MLASPSRLSKCELCYRNKKTTSAVQLDEIKKTRGGSVEDGTVARDKTLAAVLAENKAKKEEAFQEVWKTMKQGVVFVADLCHKIAFQWPTWVMEYMLCCKPVRLSLS